MPFSVTWQTLLGECEDLAEDATLLTPLSQSRFRITDAQEHRIVVEFLDRDVDETRPLQRDQFETLENKGYITRVKKNNSFETMLSVQGELWIKTHTDLQVDHDDDKRLTA